MHTTRTLSVVLALSLSSATFAQSTYYIDVNGVPPGTGSSVDPFTSIQYAFDHANVSGGDTVLVRPGVYAENLDLVAAGIGHPWASLRSTAGPLETFLVPAGRGDVLVIRQIEVEGFTISGATGGAAVRVPWAHNGYLYDCILTANEVAVHWEYDGALVHCTVAGNAHGALVDWDGILGFSNSILWDNTINMSLTPTAYGASSFCPNYSAVPIGSTTEWQCSSTGLVHGDPGLWDAPTGDYHLAPGSICIGAGGPTSVTGDLGALPFDPGYVPEPSNYCQTAPNSVGPGAVLGFSGTPSLTAADFQLTSSACPPNVFGLYSIAPAQTLIPFGDGFRCIAPGGGVGTARLNPPIVTLPDGSAPFALDFSSSPLGPLGPTFIEPGSLWNFQLFYRDPLGLGGTGFNLSDGLAVHFGL